MYRQILTTNSTILRAQSARSLWHSQFETAGSLSALNAQPKQRNWCFPTVMKFAFVFCEVFILRE